MHTDTDNAGMQPSVPTTLYPAATPAETPREDYPALAPEATGHSRGWTIALLAVFGVIAGIYILLWSPYWYPLSDSSLFLSLARNMDEGRGYTYMGRPHRMVTPLVPGMLWGLMQVSRSFGLMNASMIACMLGSFVLMYLALRQCMDRPMALLLTAVSALSYWQFRLATLIMTEQPFLLLFWAGLYAFLRARPESDRRTMWLVLGAAAMLLGIGVRVAGALFVPVIALALFVEYWHEMPLLRRVLLVGAVIAPMALAGGAYKLWGRLVPGEPREYVPVPAKTLALMSQPSNLTAEQAVPPTEDGAEAADAGQSAEQGNVSQITRYDLRMRFGLATFYRYPGVLGRWLSESVVVASREAFERIGRQSPSLAGLLGSLIAIVALVGVCGQMRARQWWLALPILYVLVFAMFWGTRYIPRYLVPVMPMVLLWLAGGVGTMLAGAARQLRLGERWSERLRRTAVWGVPSLVLLLNLPVLAVEVYAGRTSDFYGTIRQGAAAELVDAAAYIRTHLPADTVIVTNDYARRREVHLLTGRATAIPTGRRAEVDALVCIGGPQDEARIRRFFEATGARCAVIHFMSHKYPEWHVSLGRKDHGPWWGLYIWDEAESRPVRVQLPQPGDPADRQWLRHLPDGVM